MELIETTMDIEEWTPGAQRELERDQRTPRQEQPQLCWNYLLNLGMHITRERELQTA